MKSYSHRLVSWIGFQKSGCLVMLQVGFWLMQGLPSAHSDEITVRQAVRFLEKYHISQKRVDDAFSQQLFDQLFITLDPHKLYFRQQDIDSLQHHKADIHDQLRIGRINFCQDAIQLFQQCVARQNKIADQQIEAVHDFSANETVVIDPQKMTWSQTTEEMNDRWRKRVKFDLLNLKLDGLTSDESKQRLHQRHDRLLAVISGMPLPQQEEFYLNVFTDCFDKQSTYFGPLTSANHSNAIGVGMTLQLQTGSLLVRKFQTHETGQPDNQLSGGDEVLAISDASGNLRDVFWMEEDAESRLHGPLGSKVRVQVKTLAQRTKTVELTRQEPVGAGKAEGAIIPVARTIAGRPEQIGVIRLPVFYRDFQGFQDNLPNAESAAVDVQKLLNGFRDDRAVNAVVLDLRNNGGGALAEVLDVTGLLIGRGPVVQSVDYSGKSKTMDSTVEKPSYHGPLVVLTNRVTSSGAEFVAGAIQDYQRGIVIGSGNTRGVGSISNVMPIQRPLSRTKEIAAVKITISNNYRLTGESLHGRGIIPDVLISETQPLAELLDDREPLFNAVAPVAFKPVGEISKEVVRSLQDRHERRVGADQQWQAALKANSQHAQVPLRQWPLSETALREVRQQIETATRNNPPDENAAAVFGDNPENNEIVKIVLDYVILSQAANRQ